MGKKTRQIFITGIVLILLGSGYKPLLLIGFGEKATGNIIKVETHSSWFWQSADYYPAVHFRAIDGKEYVFKVGSDFNHESEMLEKVDIIYLTTYPQMAAINSFHILFDGFFIKTVLCLLLWIAFFTSFNDFFDHGNPASGSGKEIKYYLSLKKK